MDNILSFLRNWFELNGVINESDIEKLSLFMSDLGTELDKLSITPSNNGTNFILYQIQKLVNFLITVKHGK